MRIEKAEGMAVVVEDEDPIVGCATKVGSVTMLAWLKPLNHHEVAAVFVLIYIDLDKSAYNRSELS
jgi:hypothetical protein